MDLDKKFHKRVRQENYEVVNALMAYNLKDGESVCNHVQRMQIYVELLERLNVNFEMELVIEIVLNSFPSCYDQFILNYHLNNTNLSFEQHRDHIGPTTQLVADR